MRQSKMKKIMKRKATKQMLVQRNELRKAKKLKRQEQEQDSGYDTTEIIQDHG